jgi:hypothetical protein
MSARDELRTVLAPATLLAEVEGVEILLLSVELWRSDIRVQLAGLADQLMERRLRQHRELIESWGRDPNPTEPPERPEEMLGRLELTIADDLGTTYLPSSGGYGATDHQWRAEWTFEPGVPAEATRLTIAVGDDAAELAL